ncbi:hypothetical protein [Acidicapsa ligni]|uniref:hypothetical protein n=1 Tax=Acidicapsa ligni TaxID=542300 RepID=UPI0021DFB7F4|nr:hypothetical protein [Acidicapsa ligni]
MKLRWIIPLAILFPLQLSASEPVVAAHITTVVINPYDVTVLHLRPEFESTIRMPEEVTSVFLGSPRLFTAEHKEGEPLYVVVKPITANPAQSDLQITTKSGQHVTLELISNGSSDSATQPVDFLLEYRPPPSLVVSSASETLPSTRSEDTPRRPTTQPQSPGTASLGGSPSSSALDEEYAQQLRINDPIWMKWNGQQIETSLGDVRQWNNQTVISYSILNRSDQAVEIVPPQVQITGHQVKKKKKAKEGKEIIADQLEIRDYRLSATRLAAGERADGVVVFDRPSFKESNEKLFLQIAQADQVDRPILIRLPFTPPIAAIAH